MFASLSAYLAALREHAGARLVAGGALALISAVLEGVGIVLLLPLLAIATGEVDGGLAQKVLSSLGSLGIDKAWERGVFLVAAFALLLAARNLVGWFRDTFMHHLGRSFVDSWRLKTLDAVSSAQWQTVSAVRRSTLEHALTEDIDRLAAGTDRILLALVSAILIAVQLAILAGLSLPLLALVLAMLLVGAALCIPLLRRAGRMGAELTDAGRSVFHVLDDFLAGQKTARLVNAQEQFRDRYADALAGTRQQELAYVGAQAVARGWLQWTAGTLVAVAALTSFFLFDTPIAVLALAIIVLARLLGPVQQLVQAGQAVAYMLPAFDELRALSARLQRDAEETDAARPSSTGSGPASLALSGVSFGYGDGEPVLHAIDFAIEPGEMVGLSGASGSGKTTLVELACGLLIPDQGDVLGGSLALTPSSARANWRAQIACVPQEPFLFSGSARDNLCFGLQQAPDDTAISEALQVSQASAFVGKLADGLDTDLGPRGGLLSSGERQRLCIARALLRNPRLLILDEATGALDEATERRILESLRELRGRMSILLVSHRSTALELADRVVTIEQGRIAAP